MMKKAMTKDDFKNIRAKLGLTQQAMADAMYSDLRTVQRWEYGDRDIPGPVIKALELMQGTKP